MEALATFSLLTCVAGFPQTLSSNGFLESEMKRAAAVNATERYVSSSTAVVSNNGYLCFTSLATAYSNTVCGSSSIFYDNSYSCAGTGGFYYYCSTYRASVSSSGASRDGYCYDTASHAYYATACTSTSQILTDTYQTGACSGSYYGAYIYY